jgi:CheY-like chemotaxis protein
MLPLSLPRIAERRNAMIPTNHCILIADDDEILRYAMTRHLVQCGFCVIEAVDGPSAMQREAEYDGAIDVLVTDVNMPGCDGHVLGRKIKENRPDVKVIIVSGENERDFPPEARSHDLALLKPVTPQRLAAKVSELLNAE